MSDKLARRKVLVNHLFPNNKGRVAPFEEVYIPTMFCPDYKICDLIWLPIIKEIPLDHNWVFGFKNKGREQEPWGFVTEPYLKEESAEIVAKANEKFEDWGIEFLNIDPAMGTHYPPACAVIVARLKDGYAEDFIRKALKILVTMDICMIGDSV